MVKKKLSKNFDNKNSGRGHDGRASGWCYIGHNDDQKKKDEARSSSHNQTGNISIFNIIEIREEEEEDKELEEEVFMEIVSTVMNKGIEHLNVLNTKEGMIEEMNGREEL